MVTIFKTEMLKIWRINTVVLVFRVCPKAGEDARLSSKSIRQKNSNISAIVLPYKDNLAYSV